MSIVEYTIVSATTVWELQALVGHKIPFGWQPFGSPFLLGEKTIYLALVKYGAFAPEVPKEEKFIARCCAGDL